VLRTSDRSDYQANGVMALAKRVSRPPRDVANEIVAACDLAGVASVEVAGLGFLNITLSVEFLNNQLRALLGDARVGRAPTSSPETVVIDYSAPTSPRNCTWATCVQRSLATHSRECTDLPATTSSRETTSVIGDPLWHVDRALA